NTVLKFTVSYQLHKQKTPTTTEATLAMKRVDKQWKVDFSSLKTLPDKPVSVEKKAVEPKPEVAVTQPPVTPKAEPPPPVTQQPTGLLTLWTAEQLQGKAGEEKIHYLRAPDFAPPRRTQPNAALPPLKAEYLNSIRRVKLPSDKKWVALTFDLCERADEVAGYDRGVINALRDKKVKATFYAGGKWMQSHPEKTMQLMADPLFEIGNHSWTHGNLRVLQGEEVQQQIVWTQAEYERIRDNLQDKANTAGLADLMATVAPQPAGLRFPFGTCSPESLQATNAHGLSAIQWDVVSGDPAITVQPSQIVRETRAGSIVIFHANGRGRGTAAALPRIVDDLRAKGFEFVTVSELLAAGTVEAVDECYELRRGDNVGYDAQYGNGLVRIKKPKPKPKPKPVPTPATTPVETAPVQPAPEQPVP
ncbi:MAG: polysaccharide deacetylase family protein, partial [Methylococcaceae bacterium]|nr:polysaccharide deacetylase family protein [Methylococcaceae bacterium]